MSEVKIENNTPEQIAFKLMLRCEQFENINSTNEELRLYQKCLKAVKGERVSE